MLLRPSLAGSWHSLLLSICLPSNDIPVLIQCTASNLLWAGNWIPWTCWNIALSERPSLTLPSKIVCPPPPNTVCSPLPWLTFLRGVCHLLMTCYMYAFMSDGLPSSLGRKCQEGSLVHLCIQHLEPDLAQNRFLINIEWVIIIADKFLFFFLFCQGITCTQ